MDKYPEKCESVEDLNKIAHKYMFSFVEEFMIDKYYRRRYKLCDCAKLLNTTDQLLITLMKQLNLPLREADIATGTKLD